MDVEPVVSESESAVDPMAGFHRRMTERKAEHARASEDLHRRIDEVMARLPGFLGSSVTPRTAESARTLLLGVMVDYQFERQWVVDRTSNEVLGALSAMNPDALRKAAEDYRTKIQDTMQSMRDAIPEQADVLGNYVRSHWRTAFRPYGRRNLAACIGGHLTAMLDNPMASTLAEEECLGQQLRGWADEAAPAAKLR